MQGDALGDPSIGMDLSDVSDAPDAPSDADAALSDASAGSDGGGSAGAAPSWHVSDEELDGVNIFELPSASGSSLSGSESGEEGSVEEVEHEAASSDSSLDEEAFRRAIMQSEADSGDEGDSADLGAAAASDEEAHEGGGARKRKGGSGGVFAAAEDYADVIERVERSRGGVRLHLTTGCIRSVACRSPAVRGGTSQHGAGLALLCRPLVMTELARVQWVRISAIRSPNRGASVREGRPGSRAQPASGASDEYPQGGSLWRP